MEPYHSFTFKHKCFRLLFFFLSCLPISAIFAQSKKADSLLEQIKEARDDNSRVELMNEILYRIGELTQQERIDYAKKVLDLAKKQKDKVLESIITAEMGYIIAINGNNLEGSELVFTALEMAQKHKSKIALGIIYQDLAICFRNDPVKQKQYLFAATPYSEAANDFANLSSNLSTISRLYASLQKNDSALYYAQRAYEYCLTKNLELNLSHVLIQLARVNYYNLNSKGLGFEYMRKAAETRQGIENPDVFVSINVNLARMFKDDGKHDSALYYTNRAASRLEKARFTSSLEVYELYKNIYLKSNSDSAVKYFELYEKIKDSISKVSDIQQQQLLAIKKDLEIERADKQRKQNIQYALIGLGIIAFLIFFLILSRSFITSTRVIQFLSIVALLLVFEFLNLLLHPFLEKITDHNPVLMLLALVFIAALLVPLHHRIEKWATHKLVEKNREIRLAAAKKTIVELEQNKS